MNTIPQEHEENVAVAGAGYRCLFRRCPDGGYLVTCSELPPMLAFGESLTDARCNAIDEIEGWLEVLTAQDHRASFGRNGMRSF